MAKTFTNDEKREIEEKAKYILTAMDDIGKNGDAYCTDEQLFRASKTVRQASPDSGIAPIKPFCCKPVSSIRRGIICMPNGRGTMR